MNTKLMEYIIAISETNSITKAANKLFITQSALDQQLLKLEKELGVKLFNRAKNDFSLTEAGQVYAVYAKQILELKEEAYTRIGDIAERATGTLSIGLTPERGIGMFMAVYPLFYRLFPEIRAVPQEINVKRQLDMIRDGSLDFGFVTIPDASLPLPGLDYTTIIRENFLLAVPKKHPMAEHAALPGEPPALTHLELFKNDYFVLMFKESTQRALIDPLFDRAGFKPNLILETSSNHTLVSMVENGLSCSILPNYYAATNDKIALFTLEGDMTWNLVVCYKRNKYLSKAAKAFIELGTNYFRNKQMQKLKNI